MTLMGVELRVKMGLYFALMYEMINAECLEGLATSRRIAAASAALLRWRSRQIILILISAPLACKPALLKDLVHDIFVADDVPRALNSDARVNLNLDGARPAIFVNHGDAALARAVLLDGFDDGSGNGVGMAGWCIREAHEVVVLGDEDRGVDAKADGGDILFLLVILILSSHG